MICSNCGKEIPENMDFCTECGEPVEAPVIITATKSSTEKVKSEPRLMADGPFINFPGYVKALKGNIYMAAGLLGAILVYLAPFCTWIWENLNGAKNSCSMFDMAGKNAELALNQPVIKVYAVIIIVMAIGMLLLSAREYVRPLRPFADNVFLRVLPAVVCIIIYVLIVKNKIYIQALDAIDNLKRTIQGMGVSGSYDGGKGIGPILFMVGLIVYTLSVAFELANKQPDDK